MAERSPRMGIGGLPPDLLDAIKKYGHLIPASNTLNLVIGATEAPSNTASAMTNEQWMHAWVAEWQRANRAEAEIEELREELARRIPSGDGCAQ